MGALSNKGGRGQRNREEIGAEAAWFSFFSRLRRSFSRDSRANSAATPLLRPARQLSAPNQNRHATQASMIQVFPNDFGGGGCIAGVFFSLFFCGEGGGEKKFTGSYTEVNPVVAAIFGGSRKRSLQ